MFCCPTCFSDHFLKKLIAATSKKKGKCPFCKSIHVPLLNPEVLFDRFEPLLELYTIDAHGKYLVDHFKCDWNVFAILEKRNQQRLLYAITNNKKYVTSRYKTKCLQDNTNIKQWELFRDELKHNNRFFPKNAPNKSHLEPFGELIGLPITKGSQKVYRARINSSEAPFSIKQMGMPPKNTVSNGRANPIGIPYLYVASTINTAISEVRGHKGERVTVAEFDIKSDLELADLRDPKKTISPFEQNEEDGLELIYKNMPYLMLLGTELSKPVIPREANLEYLPSQYLCELIKHIGFHGIIYKSSISSGINYVIFSEKKLRPTKTYQYIITETKFESKKIS